MEMRFRDTAKDFLESGDDGCCDEGAQYSGAQVSASMPLLV